MLKWLDIESQILIVRQGKGQKDWRKLLSNLAWEIMQKYIAEYRPNRWLFPGKSSDRQGCAEGFEVVRRRAELWKRQVLMPFATQLLEKGTDILYI
ncbi:hypothetical protein V6669_07845 [Paenibacillus sp. Y5S-9]|uniref:hypothetical protein n=1 Tax=Paenibacillus sp. Y5S-9 TaxID=3122489 RepID=UPI0030D5D548